MKFRFEMFYRASLLALILIAFGAVWAGAQTNHPAVTNAVTAISANAPGTGGSTAAELVSPEWVKSLAADWPFLRYHFWGNELWKHLFSLIYIFLAFYISKLLDYL